MTFYLFPIDQEFLEQSLVNDGCMDLKFPAGSETRLPSTSPSA